MLKILKNQKDALLAPLKSLGASDKTNFWVLTLMYGFTLFTYPMIRSVTEATILQSLGMKSWNMANFYSILTLFCVVNFYNFIQKKVGQKYLFIGTSFFSLILFLFLSLGLPKVGQLTAYTMFVWKEVYIVLLVHMCLGFFNTHFTEDFAKSFFGAFGALTSIGSITGGIITTKLTASLGIQNLMFFACGVLFIGGAIGFLFKEKLSELKVKEKTKPLAELKGLWGYVYLILSIVALSQFLIYIINLNFNSYVKESILDVTQKTQFFGGIYTVINILALAIQFVITPLALKNVSLKKNHFAVGVIYLLLFAPMIAIGSGSLTILSFMFIVSKGVDYSFFGTIKEMLYYPLEVSQKYAAKYVVDMFGYRFSKAIVALFFANFFTKDLTQLMFFAFSSLWILAIYKIFSINNTLYK